MAFSEESTKVEVDILANVERYWIKKYSRWMDAEGRLLVVLGFYYGDGYKPGTALNHREALDLLSVHDERVEYVTVRRFVNLVNLGKLSPWEDNEFKRIA